MRFCLSCEKKLRLQIESSVVCALCSKVLTQNSPTAPNRYGLYAYHSFVRKLIHAVKIDGNTVALRYMLDSFIRHPEVVAASGVDFVTSPPSSLWGCLRGRIDLAACLAQEFASKYQIPYMVAEKLPVRWKTSLVKEARRSTRVDMRGQLNRVLKQRCLGHLPRYLVVDDVMTTGTTVMRYLSSLPAASVKVLTFAEVKTGGDHLIS